MMLWEYDVRVVAACSCVGGCSRAAMAGAQRAVDADVNIQLKCTSAQSTCMPPPPFLLSQARSGLWMHVGSVGDAGATCLGYFGGVFSADGRSIVAHGFTGAMHLWDQDAPDTNGGAAVTDTSTGAGVDRVGGVGGVETVGDGGGVDSEGCLSVVGLLSARHAVWRPRHALGGHWDAVKDVAWAVDGGCVLSVSDDQTARLFTATAQQLRKPPRHHRPSQQQQEGQTLSTATINATNRLHWCEVARPQVHGHDFTCVSPLPAGTRGASFAYVSGSEEKMLRVMDCTQVCLFYLMASFPG